MAEIDPLKVKNNLRLRWYADQAVSDGNINLSGLSQSPIQQRLKKTRKRACSMSTICTAFDLGISQRTSRACAYARPRPRACDPPIAMKPACAPWAVGNRAYCCHASSLARCVSRHPAKRPQSLCRCLEVTSMKVCHHCSWSVLRMTNWLTAVCMCPSTIEYMALPGAVVAAGMGLEIPKICRNWRRWYVPWAIN
jgi:hypothetical protein